MSDSGVAARGGQAARWLFRAVMLGGLALVWRLNAPGHMTVDTVLALHEGRFHTRETWNPAIFGWLLGIFDRIVPGQALAMAVSATLLFATWGVMAGLRARVSWLAVLIALAAVALPQVLIYPGIVWKDVWFTEATIVGFVAMAFAVKAKAPAGRWGLLAVSAVFFAVAGLLRQNGLILAAAAAVALAWTGWPQGWRRSVASATAWLALTAACSLGLSIVAQPQGIGPPDSAGGRGVRIVQTYDLLGAAAYADLPFHNLDRFNPTLDDKLRAEAPRLYSPERVDFLDSRGPVFSQDLSRAPASAIRADWIDLILHHPSTYLSVRMADFRQVFETPVIDRCLPLSVGADGPVPAMRDLKLVTRWTDRDQSLWNYATYFMDTPAYSHVTYALIALAVGLLLLWRRDPADIVIAGFMFGALAFVASFFVISIACDYRYLYLMDLAAITGVFYFAFDPTVSRPRERRRARR